MPISEFYGWQAYFEIYPFTQDREDARAAMLAAVIANISGKALKHPVKESLFMPEYLQREKIITDPLQRDEYAAFKAKLQG
jgi:hypothetical protein